GGIAIGNRSLSPIEYALRWAAGHATALGAIAIAAVALGVSTATALAVPAEALVAFALVAIGVQVVRAVPQRRAALAMPVAHGHDDRGASRSPQGLFSCRSARRAGIMLGLVHGTAGSAVVLALLPLTQLGGGLASVLYLACFSLGVAAGAVTFAALLTRFAARAAAADAAVGRCLKLLVGTFALVSGALILLDRKSTR